MTTEEKKAKTRELLASVANESRVDQYRAITGYMADETVGATDLEAEAEIRKLIKGYCTQQTVARCSECSLCNYGRDCHNLKVA